MGDLLTRLRYEAHANPVCDEALEEIYRLQSQLDQANARERKAFEAGFMYIAAGMYPEQDDIEQAWQQYRSQDDSEGRAVGETHFDARRPGEPDPDQNND